MKFNKKKIAAVLTLVAAVVAGLLQLLDKVPDSLELPVEVPVVPADAGL